LNGANFGTTYLVALNAATGSVAYANQIGGGNMIWPQAPAVGGGNVYYSCWPSGGVEGVCAYGESSGAPVWQYNSGTVQNALTYSNGLVFDHYSGGATGNQTGVIGINGAAGTLAHSYPYCPQGCGNGPFPAAVAKGMMFVSAPNGGLYAYHVASAKAAWSSTNEHATAPPSVANGVVYVAAAGSLTPTLIAHDASTGSVLWNSPYTGGLENGGVPGAAPPIIANGTVYAVSNTCGTVCSFSAR
jgi:outer membrane protein assembly factor BamB